MDASKKTGYVGDGELFIGPEHVCDVSCFLKGYQRAGEKMAEKTSSQLHFIGELLLLPANGEGKQVYEAVQREEKFTLRLRDNRQLQVFLLADSPEVGVYEVMVEGF